MTTASELDRKLHRPQRKVEEQEEHKPVRHFHVHELHDGTYHVEKDHGEGRMETGSAQDLDSVHDHLEEMMGTPNEGEEQEEEHSH